MNHPNLNAIRKLAGLEPLTEEVSCPYTRKYEKMNEKEMDSSRKYLESVIGATHKDSVKHKSAQEEIAVLDRVKKSLKESNESILAEAKKEFNFEKKKDDEDAKKDDKKEEKKEKSEKEEDDKDSEKDDKKEEKKEKSENEEDDKDSEKDDKKEEKKFNFEKKEDDKDSKKDDKKEENKEKKEKKEDDKDAKKDDKKEEEKVEESVEDIAARLLAESTYFEYKPAGTTEDTKLTTLKVLGSLKLPAGKGLEKHNETGFKPLSIPSDEHPKGEFTDSDHDQNKEQKVVKEEKDFLDDKGTKGDTKDTKLTKLKVLGSLKLPDGKGLEKHNETGHKPLKVPADQTVKGSDFACGDHDQNKEQKKVSLR